MWIFLFLLSCLLGYLIISFWKKDFFGMEKVFLGFSLGMGEVSLMMFFMGLVNIPLTSRNVFLALLILNFLLGFVVLLKAGSVFDRIKKTIPRLNLFEFILVAVISIPVLWSFSQTVIWPVWEWDSLALYDFRGRVIAQTYSLATNFFTSQSNLTAYNYVYPFSTSLMHALIYIGGGTNPQFIYSLYYFSFVLLLYFCLRRRVSRLTSLLLTAVLATTPEILFPSTIAYPNLPYALYFSFSTIYFWEWLRIKKDGFLVISALFLGISSWIRNSEPYWIINILFITILLLRLKKFRYLSFYFLVFFPLRELWPVFQKNIFIHAKNLVLSPPAPFYLNLTKIPEVLFFVLQYFIKDWSLYLFILFVGMWMFRTKIKQNRLIILWMLGYLVLSVGGTFFFSVSFPWWNEIGGSAERLSIFFAPLLLYLISLFWDGPLDLNKIFDGSKFFLFFGRKKKKILEFKDEK